jgi:hypothetical protein
VDCDERTEGDKGRSIFSGIRYIYEQPKFNNQQDIAEEFNKHFANVTEEIKKDKLIIIT